ncbi:MAG TPA: efflux RND transporter periplasmic adaptor subunit [Gammaproteobacteria bacterium]|nr:efflux RND transporter periplasmic adaptor subunit [Gammaproteobacteria bacterium]MCH76962.1 efflux RND transporter periplasmic adaptor subunit [Gammaproteobacteria bacterium]
MPVPPPVAVRDRAVACTPNLPLKSLLSMSISRPFLWPAVAVFAGFSLLGGCGPQETGSVKPPGILITAEPVMSAPVETVEASVGQVESLVEPVVAAEVAGRVLTVEVEVGDTVRKGQPLVVLDSEDYRLRRGAARAEIGRLEALIGQQERLVARYETLAKSDFFAKNALDDAQAQLKALRSQLAAARTQLSEAERNLARGRVLAPVDAGVAARMVNEGDYVGVGTPLLRLSTDQLLRVTLPYPEALADVLRSGLPVRLRSPAVPDTVVEGTVTEIRPTVGMANRALLVLVDLPNPGGWKPGASVDGEVILDRRDQALLVPETAVVMRPAGPTVYLVEDDRARAVVVQTGVYQDGQVEILAGLEAGALVAVDGAGFLSDGAAVRVLDGGA